MHEIFSMDYGWKFHLGDICPPKVRGHMETYFATKAGGAVGAAAVSYDVSAWRDLDLPHDWAVEMPYDPNENANHGFKPRGIACYRKTFRLPEEYNGKRLCMEFGGVATHCTVLVNGQLLHRNFCGYTEFHVDFTSIASFGDFLNNITVRVDAEAFEAWSYEGAGIYRHVKLHVTDKLYIKPLGIHIEAVKNGDNIWNTNIAAELVNVSEKDYNVTVISEIFDVNGKSAGVTSSITAIDSGNERTISQNVTVADPLLWSIETPSLFTLNIKVMWNGVVFDEQNTSFGYRTIRFDAAEGFFLNDKRVKIKGACNHQDHAGLGSALPDSIHAFRIEKLKEMGCNAYRCAHHPPARELLDACDRLGMMVMDENRNFNDSPDVIAQLETMARRDRNHPCVILWSIFNEDMIQTGESGRKMALNLVRAVKRLDKTRPVMAAINAVISDRRGAMDVLDVVGLNYFQFQYDDFHRLFPDKPVISSENNCTYGTRGEYRSSADTMKFASDDTECTEFGNLARRSWREIDSRHFVSGSFIWTGFDYKGEPYPYQWPCVNSNHGNMDVCGFPKSGFYLHQAYWTAKPMLHILPHWNLDEGESNPIRVQVYTNCEEAELFLNGRSLGNKPVDPYNMAQWEIIYTPGLLEAVGRKNGVNCAKAVVETSGEPAALILTPWRAELYADNADATPIAVSAVDKNGRFVPTAMNTVHFSLEGRGKILGVGNGRNTCLEPDKAESRSLYNGLCQVIVQSGNIAGELVLTARAEGLCPAKLFIPCAKTEREKYIPSEQPSNLVTGWHRTPISKERPDINLRLEAGDMNSWLFAETGGGPEPAFAGAPGYSLYRAMVNRPLYAAAHIIFGGIIGKAEIYIDKKVCFTKTSQCEETVSIKIPASGENMTIIDVSLDGSYGCAGITNAVKVEFIE